jgi:hypothetical protein
LATTSCTGRLGYPCPQLGNATKTANNTAILKEARTTIEVADLERRLTALELRVGVRK